MCTSVRSKNVECSTNKLTYWTSHHNYYFYRPDVRATCISSSFYQRFQSDSANPNDIFRSTRTSSENVPQSYAGLQKSDKHYTIQRDVWSLVGWPETQIALLLCTEGMFLSNNKCDHVLAI